MADTSHPSDAVASADTFPFGYCTNVHAGTTLEQAQDNLLRFAKPVQQTVVPHGKLPLGLWLAESAASELLLATRTQQFAEWLEQHQFSAYTLNGFPQGDFHQPVVKHAVYQPTWLEPSRLEYTSSLASILSQLLPPASTGSISTLPLGWPHKPWSDEDLTGAAEHLLVLARRLHTIFEETGREIVVAIEPEPGCVLNTAAEIIEFFENYLFAADNADCAQRYLSVCHDICHSGVMFEPQTEALQAYWDAEIRIGKVQVSSAVHVPWDRCVSKPELFQQTLEQLSTFNEPKYLHQATRSTPNGQLEELCDDIAHALSLWVEPAPQHPWRVHFHIPIFVEQFGTLDTTQSDIKEAVGYLEANRQRSVGQRPWFTGHYEVETYAWPVLPASLAAKDLASGISLELEFFRHLLAHL